MSTLTIQNVSHRKINMRVFCSSNIFLCQEILSSELSFAQQRKQLLSELIGLEDFITLTDFQFKFLSIDIIHNIRIGPSREKLRQNDKALLLFSFYSFFFVGNIAPDF